MRFPAASLNVTKRSWSHHQQSGKGIERKRERERERETDRQTYKIKRHSFNQLREEHTCVCGSYYFFF
jgi:hypothetical protein